MGLLGSGTRSTLQRQNSNVILGGGAGRRRPDNTFYDAQEVIITPQQQALLQRFGLTGDAARNEPAIARYFAKERIGSNAYRAVQLSRAISRGTYGMRQRRAPRAAPLAGWSRTLPKNKTKADYDREMAKALARKNQARVLQLRQAYQARRLNARVQDLAQRTARKLRRRMIHRGIRTGPQSFALNTGMQRRVGPTDTVSSAKRALGDIWSGASDLSRVTLGKSLERVLQETIAAHGADMVGQMARAKQKWLQGAAAAGQQAVGALTALVAKSTCGVAGMGGPLVALAAWAVGTHLGNKAYVVVEQNYARAVDRLVSKYLSKVDMAKAAGTVVRGARKPMAVLRMLVDNVPACVRAPVVGVVLRVWINSYVRVYAGVELDYVKLARILTDRIALIENFLLGNEVRFKPLIMDLVDIVPPAQLTQLASTAQAEYQKFLAKGSGRWKK